MDYLVKWKKPKGKWTVPHRSFDGAITLCGRAIPDESWGTGYAVEIVTGTDVRPENECKVCNYSYIGLRPQLRRIANHLPNG